jgi:hypothetical protein
MNCVSIAVRRTAKLLTALAVAAALAGCMITSKAELVADAEGTQVWPASVYVYGYEQDKDVPNNWTRATDAPMQFTLSGNSYASADGSMTLRFVPLDAPDTYLLAMVAADGSMYGTSIYRDNLLAVNVILSDSDPAAIVATEKSGAGATALAGVTVEDGALVITDREGLDYVIQMTRDGKLKLGGLVMAVDEKPDAAVPAKLVPDGDFFKAAS